MKPEQIRQNPMRKIAENELHTVFGDGLSPEVENELATALVRQWTTYDGYAGVLADQARFWWQLKKTESGYELSRSQNEGCVLEPFIRSRGIDPGEVPLLLHRLNVSQSAEVETIDGKRLRLFMKPKERTIGVEDLAAAPFEP